MLDLQIKVGPDMLGRGAAKRNGAKWRGRNKRRGDDTGKAIKEKELHTKVCPLNCSEASDTLEK